MFKIIIWLSFLSIILFSCSKELSNENGISISGKLLMKVVVKSANDSTTTNYQYDNNGRLIRETISGTSNGISTSSDYQITRNSNGIITQTIQKSAALLQSGIDSIVRAVHSDVTGKYTSSVFPVSLNGINAIDSTVFIYNPTGQVAEENSYAIFQGLSLQVGILNFTYSADGKNIVSENLFADTSLTSLSLVQVGSTSFTLDNKVSPLILPGSEAFAIQREQLFNSNNALQVQQNDLINPGNSISTSETFIYNSSNEPSTATLNYLVSGSTYSVTYYYQ